MDSLARRLEDSRRRRISDEAWAAYDATHYVLERFRTLVRDGQLPLSDTNPPHFIFNPIGPVPNDATFRAEDWVKHQGFVVDLIRRSTGLAVTQGANGVIELHLDPVLCGAVGLHATRSARAPRRQGSPHEASGCPREASGCPSAARTPADLLLLRVKGTTRFDVSTGLTPERMNAFPDNCATTIEEIGEALNAALAAMPAAVPAAAPVPTTPVPAPALAAPALAPKTVGAAPAPTLAPAVVEPAPAPTLAPTVAAAPAPAPAVPTVAAAPAEPAPKGALDW